MKKICFVATVSLTIKSFLLSFGEYLIDNGYSVTFICNPDPELFSFIKAPAHFIPVKMKRGISIDGPSVVNRLTKIFKKEKFDIVQYSTPNAAFYASIAAKKANIRERLYCEWGIRYMGYGRGLTRLIFKYIEKKTCDNSTNIEVESFSLLAFGLKEGLYSVEKAEVVWNGSACGVDLKKFDYSKRQEWRQGIRRELSFSDDDIVFGYAGRITRDKGINELLLSFKLLGDEKKAKLLIVGTFDNDKTIERGLKKWALSNKNIIVIPWSPCLEKYYSAMDVFVSLSYREGFGLVVVEAAAMGLPGIVSDVPGQSDTIDKTTGILVPVRDAQSASDALLRFLRIPNMCVELGQNSHIRSIEMFEQRKLFEKLKEHRDFLVEGAEKHA